MDKQKTTETVRKIEAFVIGSIGVCIFSLGTTYFQEPESYYVPGILTPFFKLLGNVGLAIGILIPGGVLICYGFTKWNNYVSEKKFLYGIYAAIGLIIGIILANILYHPN